MPHMLLPEHSTVDCNYIMCMVFNPFKPSGVKWLHFRVFKAILVNPTNFNFFDIRALWRSGLSTRVPECQKIKNDGLEQYGAEHFRTLIFATVRKIVELKGSKTRTNTTSCRRSLSLLCYVFLSSLCVHIFNILRLI